MTIANPPTRITPDDLLQLENEGLFELVGGQLVEKKMGLLANATTMLIGYHLMGFIRRSNAGVLASEQSIQCFPQDPDLIRRPDICFIETERARSLPDEGHVRIAPDLAIEVTSPNDTIDEFEEKLADYRSAGIKLVWEVNPRFRFVQIHRPNRSVERPEEGDTLTGEQVLPGFSIPVKDLFPPAV